MKGSSAGRSATGERRPQRSFWCKLRAFVYWEAPITLQRDNLAPVWGSRPRRDASRGRAALLLLAVALLSSTAAAQRTAQPVFTELFSYDPAAPSELLRKWRISSQLDSELQPLRVGVVEDPIGKTVGRITVQEGDGLAGTNEAMLQARH